MFTLRIETKNAAFSDDPAYEVARIVLEVAERISAGATEGRVHDEAGNVVGHFRLTGAPRVTPGYERVEP